MKIEDIKKISLEEGDVLAVQLPKETTKDQIDNFLKYINMALPNNKCIVYTDEIVFKKLTGSKK